MTEYRGANRAIDALELATIGAPVQGFENGEMEGGLISGISYPTGNAGEIGLGVSLAAIVSCADTFAFMDTYDLPFYTNTIDEGLLNFTGSSNGALQHGGRYNANFMDGHAKNIQFRGAYWPKKGGWRQSDAPQKHLRLRQVVRGSGCAVINSFLGLDAVQPARSNRSFARREWFPGLRRWALGVRTERSSICLPNVRGSVV